MSSAFNSSQSMVWQDRLYHKCREANIPTPAFQIMSELRGSRTAWTSSVTIQGQTYTARYFYDGKNINNAKEDAAELALQRLTNSSVIHNMQGRTVRKIYA